MIPDAIPTDGRVGMKVFTPSAYTLTSSNRGYVTWDKPQGASWIYILNQNPGGGGGGGCSGAAGTARGGGGGGGSGSRQGLLVPAHLIPNRLFLQVNAGGTGGAANGPGNNGLANNISIEPNAANNNVLTYLGQGGNRGDPGTASAGGAGGTAGSAGSVGVFTTGAAYYTIAGQAGTAGGAQTGAAGGALTLPTTIGTTGGTGGGGTPTGNTNFAGGAIPAGGPFPAIAGGTAAGGAGNPGFNRGLRIDSIDNRLSAFFTTGGTGGGSNGAAGVGGVGGEGGWGSGGGGGGAGVTGGAGGKGGDGFVIIMWW